VDNCPALANEDQADDDSDGIGNACDSCALDADNDSDGDGICGDVDNCPALANEDQADDDSDGIGNACDSCALDADNDSDGDGICGNVDNCPALANEDQADDDSDGIGNACDSCALDADNDSDGDGICGDVDNCPALANADQADDDSDGIGNACDSCPLDAQNDADGDGICGDVDNCPALANEDQADDDSDGIGNACDSCALDADNDSDGDGICGDVDNCPALANEDQADDDSDGIGNACDSCALDADNDSDGDGICGDVDNCPALANEDQADDDSDGIGNACDSCALDADNDSDGDGICGDVDNCPALANADQADDDSDGIGNACDSCALDADNDSDGDGICGDVDNCPALANEDQADDDSDGIGNACDSCALDADNDSDGDGICGDVDNCPALANEDQADDDDDGIGNACDSCALDADNDSDGDGICGDVDNCPALANEDQADDDDDGIGNACDSCALDADNDSDGDGICGDVDNCPALANEDQADDDDDGIGNACDSCALDADNDSDGDGICGDVDNCPALANEDQADDDSDGIGNACDSCPLDALNDADGDGICGDVDNCPALANEDQADDDDDGIGNACDSCALDADNDSDGDGICGNVDNCPALANEDQADDDGDGIGNVCDSCPLDAQNDADGDGICGDLDNCPLIANPDQFDSDGDGRGDACDGLEAGSDSVETPEDTPVDIPVLSNDADPDGGTISLVSCSNGNHGQAEALADSQCRYTPDENFNGSDSFSYIIEDDNGGSAVGQVSVIVTPVNDPPVAMPDSATTNEDIAVDVDVLLNDEDPDTADDPADIISLVSCDLSSDEGGTVSVQVPAGPLTYSPPADYNGPDRFNCVIADLADERANADVTVEVTPINDAPRIDPIANQQVDEGVELIVPITCEDVEDDSVVIDGGNLPTGAVVTDLGGCSGEFRWTPDFLSSGNYPDVLITATDDGSPLAQGQETFTITVGDFNLPPAFSDDIPSRVEVDENEPIFVRMDADDPDEPATDLVFRALDTLPDGATYSGNLGGYAELNWTPDFGQAGEEPLRFEVCDNGTPTLCDRHDLTIAVGNVPRTPEMQPIGDREIDELEQFSLVVTATDPDTPPDEAPSLSLSLVSSEIVQLTSVEGDLPEGALFTDNGNGTGRLDWTPTYDQGQRQYLFEACATDSVDPTLTDCKQFTVTVGNINRPPELTPIGDKTVTETDLLSFTVSANDPDPDGIGFTLASCSDPALPAAAQLTDNGDRTASFSWTPVVGDAAGSPYCVTFTATDDFTPDVRTDAETISITVEPAAGPGDDPPYFDPAVPSSQTIGVSESLELDVCATDPEGKRVAVSAEGLPQGAQFRSDRPGCARLTWKPGCTAAGEHTVSFTADDGTQQASTSTTIEVTAAPVEGAIQEEYLLSSLSYDRWPFFVFEYRVAFRNATDCPIDGLTATVSSSSDDFQVREADVSFDRIPAQRKRTSQDSFSVRYSIFRRLDKSVLSWEVSQP
jgi:hypothetical protein